MVRRRPSSRLMAGCHPNKERAKPPSGTSRSTSLWPGRKPPPLGGELDVVIHHPGNQPDQIADRYFTAGTQVDHAAQSLPGRRGRRDETILGTRRKAAKCLLLAALRLYSLAMNTT